MSNQNKSKKEKSQNAQGIRIFVYGSLKDGHGNHAHYFKGNPQVEYLGRCGIEGAFSLYGGTHFPYLVPTEDGSVNNIYGEVYRVSEKVLDVVDILEGHPHWYRREKVATPWKKAWVYVMQDKAYFGQDSSIPSGMWRPTEEELKWYHENA